MKHSWGDAERHGGIGSRELRAACAKCGLVRIYSPYGSPRGGESWAWERPLGTPVGKGAKLPPAFATCPGVAPCEPGWPHVT